MAGAAKEVVVAASPEEHIIARSPTQRVCALATHNRVRPATTDDEIAVWSMNGTAISAGAILMHPGTLDWRIEAFTDINGDGNADIVFQNQSDARMNAWTMDGFFLSPDGTGTMFTLPTGYAVVGQGDFNAGGMGGVMLRSDGAPSSILRAQTQTTFATAGATLATIGNDFVVIDPMAKTP